jgi:diguanylate cyclase (GGDEF)-like protein
MRKNDTVARLGGDEFVCLFENIQRDEDAAAIANKILGMISEPFQLGSEKILITGSIGISLYPRDGENVDRLVKNADAAMYRVKDRGKNHFEFFSVDPQDHKTVQ